MDLLLSLKLIPMEGRLKKHLKLINFCLIVTLVFTSVAGILFYAPQKAEAAGVDPNNLCSDTAFVNYNALNAAGIQNFLKSKGSFLANFSDGGKSAAQIIYEAAQSNKVNPYAVLAMIQKEEGLITGSNSKSLNQTRVDWAIGYGYTDSVIMDEYKGFRKQIENGIWQLRRNYDVWASNGSKWNVGKTMNIDGKDVKFGNRCTSAQYRYTPHLGTNFSYYFNLWNTGGTAAAPAASGNFDAQYVTQGPRTGAGSPGVNLVPGQRFMVWVNYKNTGGAVWRNAGAGLVRIGTSDPQDRGSAFMSGKSLRGTLAQPAVVAGATGTFQIWLTAPKEPGTYTEKFKPVVEGQKWMGEEAVWTFNVVGKGGQTTNNSSTVTRSVAGVSTSSNANSAEAYSAQYMTQGPRTGPASPTTGLLRNQNATLWVNFRNTGSATWYKTGYNAVHIGTSDPQDRGTVFAGGANRRGSLVQAAVKPGEIGTFLIPITAPKTSGEYTEKFQLVAEHITWFNGNAEWKLKVK